MNIGWLLLGLFPRLTGVGSCVEFFFAAGRVGGWVEFFSAAGRVGGWVEFFSAPVRGR